MNLSKPREEWDIRSKMKLHDFIKDKILMVLGQILAMMLLSIYLIVTGYPKRNCGLIIVVWVIAFLSYLVFEFMRRKKFFQKIDQILTELDQPYLLAEVMENGYRLEDKLYRDILRRSNKSVIEKIHQVETDRNEYKEFIESWVHEIKTPLTVIQLICENQKDMTSRKIMTELVRVERYIDTALFYARAGQVYKDFMIQQVDLKEIVTSVLKKDKLLLIENKMTCFVDFEKAMVPSDSKWVEFIINQLVINAVKYRKEECVDECEIDEKPMSDLVFETPRINFSVLEGEASHQKSLVIWDNGIGIPERELARVFDKGFTGSNGRNREKATGIGLYLCNRLCEKLDLKITVESVEGEYTKVILTFPCLEKML